MSAPNHRWISSLDVAPSPNYPRPSKTMQISDELAIKCGDEETLKRTDCDCDNSLSSRGIRAPSWNLNTENLWKSVP